MSTPSVPVELTVKGGLSLRPLREIHLDQVMTALSDPDVALWNPLTVGAAGLRAATLDYIRRRGDWSSGSHASWGIFASNGAAGGDEGHEVLGSVALHRIDPVQCRAEIGYWTSPWARGMGVATLAVRTVVAWGFEELGLFRLALTHADGNVASCRVAQKTGFQLEGVMRSSFVYGDGRRYDEHLHGLLPTDLA